MERAELSWNQQPFRFALADLRRNWLRHVFWALSWDGIVVVVTLINNARHAIRQAPGVQTYGLFFVMGFVFQIYLGLCRRKIRLSDDSVILGESRASAYFPLRKIAVVELSPSNRPSMILTLYNGRQVEIFLDVIRVPRAKIESYFSEVGIEVMGGEKVPPAGAIAADWRKDVQAAVDHVSKPLE